jgi:hypothetical protein
MRLLGSRTYFANWLARRLLHEGIFLVPSDAQLQDWRSDYANMRQEMFYGKVPSFDEIIDVVRRFQDTFNQGQV